MNTTRMTWTRHVVSLTLIGATVGFGVSCGATDRASPIEDISGVESPMTSAQTEVRSLVVQVTGMKKSQGGST